MLLILKSILYLVTSMNTKQNRQTIFEGLGFMRVTARSPVGVLSKYDQFGVVSQML